MEFNYIKLNILKATTITGVKICAYVVGRKSNHFVKNWPSALLI